MNGRFLIFVIGFATLVFQGTPFLSAQRLVLQNGKIDEQLDLSTTDSTFECFCKIHNSGELDKLVNVLSPKTKSTMIHSRLVVNLERSGFEKISEKWVPELEKHLANKESDLEEMETAEWSHLFADWEQLDNCLQDVLAATPRKCRPHYLPALYRRVAYGENFLVAKFSLRVPTGLIGEFDFDSKRAAECTESVYFIRIDDKWLVSSKSELDEYLESLVEDAG